MGQPRYLTVSEAANRAEVSNRTIQRAIDSEELEGIRTPYGRLVNPEGLRVWIDRRQFAVQALPFTDDRIEGENGTD